MNTYIERWAEDRFREVGFTKEVCGDADWRIIMDGLATIYGKERSKEKMGLLVGGTFGVGKTMFVKALFPNAECINLTLPERSEYIDATVNESYVNRLLKMSVVILDDVGAENRKNTYGVQTEVVGDFICRYFEKGEGRLFITTNLTGEQLLDRYGGRVMDRLKTLCVPIKLNGNSKRKFVRPNGGAA